MSKLDASVVKQAYDRVASAKATAYQAHKALEATAEYRAAQDADKELELAEDGLPMDYTDEKGISWWMQACGHRQGGPDHSTYGLCPNCEFMAKRGISILIVYPDLLKKDMKV